MNDEEFKELVQMWFDYNMDVICEWSRDISDKYPLIEKIIEKRTGKKMCDVFNEMQ